MQKSNWLESDTEKNKFIFRPELLTQKPETLPTVFVHERNRGTHITQSWKFMSYFVTGLKEDFLINKSISILYLTLNSISKIHEKVMKRFNDWTDGNKLKKILICLTDSAEVEKLKEIKFMCIEKDI